MLQQVNNTIQEVQNGISLTYTGQEFQQYTNGIGQTGYYVQPYYYYQSYPVYICTDKTKKAIEVLKTLQSEKLLECKSVNKFIELVEKISNIL